jgi:hypothetical protein
LLHQRREGRIDIVWTTGIQDQQVEGRKAYIEREGGLSLIARVKALRDQRPRLSLREIAAELERDGHVTAKGNRYSASAIQSMLRSR